MVTGLLTPKRHEDGKKDGGTVVEHVSRFDVKADLVVVPVATTLVAHRTHREAVVCVATFLSVAHTQTTVKS